jgi:hypothetical protein
VPVGPIPDFDAVGDPGDDRPPQPGEHPPSDEELCGLIFDPDSSPPDGVEAWLADLPDPVRNAYLDSVAAQSPPAAPEAIAAGFLHRDGGRGRGFAAGGLLDVMEPGAVLAGFAGDAWADGLDRLTDDELVGVLCAWRRLASWSAAGEIAAVSTLARRRAAESAGAGQQRLADHVDGEIAAALTLTGRSADRLLELAAGLARLPGTSAALATGQIDWPRAIVITDEVASLGRADAAAVEARILGDAPGQTTGQLRARVRRAVLEIDPDAAIRRREKAQKDARVETWTEPSGTAALAGRDLPPADVITADKRIDSLARWLKRHGAGGTLQQLRAGVYTALLNGRPLEALLPGGGSAGDGLYRQPAARRSPDDVPGGPGAGGRPGESSASDGRGGGSSPAGCGPADGSGGAGAGCSAGPLTGQAGAGLAVPPTLGGSVNLTVPLASWLELSNAPGEAAGLDALDAATCRDLAAALAAAPRSRWCVTITGPDGRAVAHGCARSGPGPPGTDRRAWLSAIKIKKLEAGDCTHQRETAAYRVPPALRHLINIRQRTCSSPRCRRSAVHTDQDHTVPFEQGGRTCECNCGPFCRAHHQAKQAPRWHVEQSEPGTFVWTLPSGRRYTAVPDTYPI